MKTLVYNLPLGSLEYKSESLEQLLDIFHDTLIKKHCLFKSSLDSADLKGFDVQSKEYQKLKWHLDFYAGYLSKYQGGDFSVKIDLYLHIGDYYNKEWEEYNKCL